ncbi:MAG TPA: hypothetical protein VFQ73_18320 [Flavisolibacter sp.]|nr:hypothetical protein [Flavisolibacter sp.]
MDTGIQQLQTKVNAYKEVLQLTHDYRQAWQTSTKTLISTTLKAVVQQTGLKATVVEKNNIENLEAIVLDLGRSSSGIAENLDNTDVKRIMIKDNGSLIFQQLFNGKIMVMMVSPNIEGYGEPKAPVSLEIVRPGEVTDATIYGYVERMLDDIIDWEDYDDDDKNARMAFQPIGFKHTVPLGEGNGHDAADPSQQ